MVSEYSKDSTETYSNPITGINLTVSKLSKDAVNHINKEIRFTGIETDELYIIFKNSVNSYNSGDHSASVVTAFEEFMDELFR
jgi:hypothetical protein